MEKTASQAQYITAFIMYKVLKDHNWWPMDDETFNSITHMSIILDEEDRNEYQNDQPCID